MFYMPKLIIGAYVHTEDVGGGPLFPHLNVWLVRGTESVILTFFLSDMPKKVPKVCFKYL